MKRKLALLIVIITTFGILATFIDPALKKPEPPLTSSLAIFKYFTIQSNIVVIIYFSLYYSLKLDKHEIFSR